MMRPIWGVVLAGAMLLGCDRGEYAVESDTSSGLSPTPNTESTQQLIDKIMHAPTSVSWQGRRRYEAHYPSGGSVHDLMYEETVVTDGTGKFQVQCEDLLVPALDVDDEAVFLMSQNGREGMVFRHRDPIVRRKNLFFQNFVATDLGQTVALLGRDCADLSIVSQYSGQAWRALVDLQTGVILRLEERDPQGSLVSRFEYLTFAIDPALDGAVWHQSPVSEAPLDMEQAAQVLGFTPHLPKSVPAGYAVINTEHVIDPITGRDWARLTYSDGWNSLVVMDGGGAASAGAAPLTIQPDLQADWVRHFELGPWTLAEGLVNGRSLLVMGRMPLADVQTLIQSLVY